ncbi:hypothetical protein GLAREA_00580 [Glarea lozoyensis ATCC 20868]|uniref:Uncharacterized protein n=1 Tax=Glarea lozoyensis (strain ATCC 20868 / MF5171) TaxID=1116229 RepID=S3CUV2_GLAL2|nr:uncharacterized protein GLAREA_00580 [Glarea lozoyensis ATCC 20868]EPE29420.1 hypothetical protein GLAREA_00580 [Glarea lozoyensis ATCC 20868]
MVCNSVSCRAGNDKTSCLANTRQAAAGPLNPEIKVVPMTGVRCPTCTANGQESWVIPGRACGYCGTNC